MPEGPYRIGSQTWPFLAMVQKDAGELNRILLMLVDVHGRNAPDSDITTRLGKQYLKVRLEQEVADILASIHLLCTENDLDMNRIGDRKFNKIADLVGMHQQELAKN